MKLLEKQRALITGAARGIGREVALKFLHEGASLYYVDIEEGDSKAEYEALARTHGAEVYFAQLNVADEQQVEQVMQQILEKSGGIDILVNNAGITRDNLLFRMSSQEWNDVLTINLTSMFYISRIIGRAMIKQRRGAIINVASIVGIIGNGGQTNYSASKAGVVGFTKSMAREVASRNVRVNAVAPGFIQTKMTEKLNEEQKRALTSQIPLGRIGDPDEVAKVILFLASDMASYLTGQVIHITGGLGM